MWRLHLGRDPRLTQEARDQFRRLLGQVEGQNLHGHFKVKPGMDAVVDGAHSALTYFCEQGNATQRRDGAPFKRDPRGGQKQLVTGEVLRRDGQPLQWRHEDARLEGVGYQGGDRHGWARSGCRHSNRNLTRLSARCGDEGCLRFRHGRTLALADADATCAGMGSIPVMDDFR